MNELSKEQLIAKNRELDSNNRLLVQELNALYNLIKVDLVECVEDE